jgi:hypothetical protein
MECLKSNGKACVTTPGQVRHVPTQEDRLYKAKAGGPFLSEQLVAHARRHSLTHLYRNSSLSPSPRGLRRRVGYVSLIYTSSLLSLFQIRHTLPC